MEIILLFVTKYPIITHWLIGTLLQQSVNILIAEQHCLYFMIYLNIFRTETGGKKYLRDNILLVTHCQKLWRSKNKPLPCNSQVWLGVFYNSSIRDYAWTDGSPLTFTKFLPDHLVENSSITFLASGSVWRQGVTKARAICQLRLSINFTF